MATIQMTAPETSMLCDILESYLGDLRMEVANTDSLDFRTKLKDREEFIKDLLSRLVNA